MKFPVRLQPPAVAVGATTLILVLSLENSARAQNGTRRPLDAPGLSAGARVGEQVYQSVLASPDGRAGVLICLEGFAGLRGLAPAKRRKRIVAAQTAVMNALHAADFDLGYQYRTIPVLAGSVSLQEPAPESCRW